MAQKKSRVTSKSTYLIVWGIEHTTLRADIVSGAAYTDINGDYSPLDTKLLLLLQEHEKALSKLAGIGVVATALGGFASSRLLLATLNVYAWLRQVPIVSIPASWEHKPRTEIAGLIQPICSSAKGTQQLLPEYQRPANTTVSKKKKRFTLS
jgi:hypothetical protein